MATLERLLSDGAKAAKSATSCWQRREWSYFVELTVGRDATDLVLGAKNGTPWTKSAQARPMREACERAKIRPAIGFHILRHTWASLAIKAGLPLWMVARNLGHSDTRMVEKHYGHVEQDFIAKAIREAAPQFDTEPSNVAAIG